jgi:hypothetical protein
MATLRTSGLLVPAILCALATPAWAVGVRTTSDAAPTCTDRYADVVRWTPADGPVVPFLVDGRATLVALGRTDAGFWSAVRETGDACDSPGCARLDLLYTPFDGSPSTRYPVQVWGEGDRYDQAELRRIMVQRLWRLASTVWPVRDLRHDYALVTPKAGGDAEVRHPGWLAEVVMAGRWRVRYDHDVRPFMCWCHHTWRAQAR